MHKCSECGEKGDCRPYGKDWAWVCFDCGLENMQQTVASFYQQLDAAGPTAVVTEEGPVPVGGGKH